MPFTPTTFYDNASPQLTAAELNKLGAGVARAQATADSATTAATAATTAASAATSAVALRTRVVRVQDGPVVTGTTLTPDSVLSVTLTGVATHLFLVTFALVYNADANCLGSISVSASNGSTSTAGADAYWVSLSRTATSVSESAVGGYFATGVSASRRDRLTGNLGDASPSPRLVHGYAHVRNGTGTGPLMVTISTAESIGTDRAVTGSGMQLLTGSVLTVSQVA